MFSFFTNTSNIFELILSIIIALALATLYSVDNIIVWVTKKLIFAANSLYKYTKEVVAYSILTSKVYLEPNILLKTLDQVKNMKNILYMIQNIDTICW